MTSNLKPHFKHFVIGSLIAALGASAYVIAAVTFLDFTTGTTISSTEMNTKLNALKNAVNSGRVAGTQQTDFVTATNLDTTTNVQLMSLALPGSASGNAILVAHAYVEKASGTTGRYELTIHSNDCAGTILGLTLWRPGSSADSFVADAITLTGAISSATGATTIVLCGRKFDSTAPTGTVYARGLNGAW
jgi:hypothetical protein